MVYFKYFLIMVRKGGTNPHYNILQNLKNLTQNLKHFCRPPPEEANVQRSGTFDDEGDTI